MKEVYNRVTWHTLFIINFQMNKKAYLETLKIFTHTSKYLYDPIHIKKIIMLKKHTYKF